MPVITFDDFGGGLDVRPQQFLARPNILRVLQNAYVTTGKTVKKRPCLMAVATLEAGTVGLKSFKGKLQTFYGQGTTITHANTLFKANRVPKWDTGAANPVRIHYADQYNAILYVVAEFAGSVYRHYYLDDPGSCGDRHGLRGRTPTAGPTTANGFRYKVTAILGTGPRGRRAGVADDDRRDGRRQRWRESDHLDVPRLRHRGHELPAHEAGDEAVAEDVRGRHGRHHGALLQDGRPARLDDGERRGLPAGWPLCARLRPGDRARALRQQLLVVFFSDNSQLWKVDPNPANMSLTWNIEGVGTLFAKASGPVSHDLFFLAQTGFRSASVQQLTNNVQEADIGSAIDALVRADIASSDDPISIYYPKLGQFWSIIGNRAWVYSFSRASKISAWSKFTFPFTIDDACVLNQELYVRTGNDVYKVSDAVTKDGVSSIPLVDVLMYPQDGKRPGVTRRCSPASTSSAPEGRR
jgi:hypothetical protein